MSSTKLSFLLVLLVKTVTCHAAEFNLKQQNIIKEISGSVVREMLDDVNSLKSQLKFGQYLNSDYEVMPCSDICTEPQSQDCQYLCPDFAAVQIADERANVKLNELKIQLEAEQKQTNMTIYIAVTALVIINLSLVAYILIKHKYFKPKKKYVEETLTIATDVEKSVSDISLGNQQQVQETNRQDIRIPSGDAQSTVPPSTIIDRVSEVQTVSSF